MSKDCADMIPSGQQVAAFLDKLHLHWLFEFPVFVYDEQKRPRVWAPDFFIPKLGVYIEVCDLKGSNYKYRKKMYSANNVRVVFVNFNKDPKKWRESLLLRLREIETQRHVEAKKLIENAPYVNAEALYLEYI